MAQKYVIYTNFLLSKPRNVFMPSTCADIGHKNLKFFPNDVSRKIAAKTHTLVIKFYSQIVSPILLTCRAYSKFNIGTVIAYRHLGATQK
jgi:hypothetical protein